QLGCGSVLNFNGSSSSSPEHNHECVTGFQCSGSEAHLGNCSSPQTLNCSSTQQLSIACLGRGSIRLVGSGGDCAGRLEVFHSGSWRTVCDDSWDIKDAHVVCRQLQCGVALSNQQVQAWFGPGSGPIWLDEVECEGNETSLVNTSTQGGCRSFLQFLRSTSGTPPQTPPVPPVLVTVLVVVLLLLLVPLLILIQQNRVMRR
ncbi:hypothetical protein M9458_051525, partial [Cirrhinus mrigala]